MTKTYSIFAKGNFGPAHPRHDPRVVVTLRDGDEVVESKTFDSGAEGHRYALERGYSLPADHYLHQSDKYQALLASIRYKEAGL